MSEGETNSETIDDFSQYSTKTNDNNSPELCANSGQNTLASKSVPVKIIQNDDTFRESQYDELLNDGTDNMDDVMIQISKRTTVKKIITKTTSVNGVTQSNETESFFKDSQVNDTVPDNGLKSDRSPKSTNLSNHMEDSQDDMLDKESPTFHGNHQGRSRDNSLSDVEQIKNRESSPTKKMQTLHRRDIGRDPITPKGDHTHPNRETMETPRKQLGIPIHVEKQMSPHSEVKEKKIKERKRDETFDIPDHHRAESKNKFDQKLSPNSEINSKHPSGSYLRSNKESPSHKRKTKDKRESGKYIHEPEKIMKSNKSNATQNGYNDDSEKDNSTIPNHIKWVDPLKSYHLKYDLSNNNRALLHQIKEKRVALQNSNPNFQMKDQIDKKISRLETKPSSKSSRKMHNETKQFIIRGNLKENSFQNRHSLNRQKTQDYSFQNNKKQDGSKLSRINYPHKRSHRSLTNLNDIVNDKSITRSESRNGDLTPQVSQILDEFELSKHKKEVIHTNNFGVSRYCLARCGHQDCCCLNYCANFHIHCNPCCWQSCHIRCPLNNLSENRRCLSYQNLSSGRISSDVESEDQFNMRTPERTSNFENSNISHNGLNGFSSNKKHIAYLERKLSSIENKIRNMQVNESIVTYQRENDLEKQCQDIERQLVALYKTSINYREAF